MPRTPDFGEARSLLHGPPSEEAFAQLLTLLERACLEDPDAIEALWVPYYIDRLADWPAELRVIGPELLSPPLHDALVELVRIAETLDLIGASFDTDAYLDMLERGWLDGVVELHLSDWTHHPRGSHSAADELALALSEHDGPALPSLRRLHLERIFISSGQTLSMFGESGALDSVRHLHLEGTDVLLPLSRPSANEAPARWPALESLRLERCQGLYTLDRWLSAGSAPRLRELTLVSQRALAPGDLDEFANALFEERWAERLRTLRFESFDLSDLPLARLAHDERFSGLEELSLRGGELSPYSGGVHGIGALLGCRLSSRKCTPGCCGYDWAVRSGDFALDSLERLDLRLDPDVMQWWQTNIIGSALDRAVHLSPTPEILLPERAE
jgi:hypothetical protein